MIMIMIMMKIMIIIVIMIIMTRIIMIMMIMMVMIISTCPWGVEAICMGACNFVDLDRVLRAADA